MSLNVETQIYHQGVENNAFQLVKAVAVEGIVAAPELHVQVLLTPHAGEKKSCSKLDEGRYMKRNGKL